MPCGCKKGNKQMESKEKSMPVVAIKTEEERPKSDNPPPESDVGSKSFDDPLACGRCYAKHLGKSLVLFREWREDNTRAAELALCIGNIGCAEDHAAALGKDEERKRLHDLRELIYEHPSQVESALKELAAGAIRSALPVEVEFASQNQLESQRGPGVENTAEPARTEEH